MKKIKIERGYSNEQIAESSGVPLSTVQKIFAGITLAPRYDTLAALERFFLTGASFVRDTSAYYEAKSQGEYTLEDYYALPDDHRAELIDGVIYDMSAPTTIHQIIQGSIFASLRQYIKQNKGGCIPMMAPADVRLDCDNATMVQPDVMVICDKEKIKRPHIEGAPDFVVEILSPSTKAKDIFTKGDKYFHAGVREYWIIDPEKLRITTHIFTNCEDIDSTIYTFDDQIPVTIFGGKCVIDFAEILEEIRFLSQQ